jgi:predicted transcriptional regulator of viral defense system
VGKTDLRAAIMREFVQREPLFTSAAAASRTGGTSDSIARLLTGLARQGLILKVQQGLWANPAHTLFSPYLVVGHLRATWGQPTYVSFVSALQLHGMLSQIPREIHVATDRQRRPLRTPVGHYVFHRLPVALLTGDEPGDEWGRFQRATPEKALFDTVYASLYPGQMWRHLPEIELPAEWDWDRWTPWLAAIKYQPVRRAMEAARERMTVVLPRSA